MQAVTRVACAGCGCALADWRDRYQTLGGVWCRACALSRFCGDTMAKCEHILIPATACYIRFRDKTADDPKRSTRDIGRTVRGEMMIADFDAEGRIIGIELVGGSQPCQLEDPMAPDPPSPAAGKDD